MGRRAESLAARIEEGAARLAAFAEGLSETEWHTPVPGSGRDGRSVGVIVHHVASVYPIEIDLARTIASGKAVTDWPASVLRCTAEGTAAGCLVAGACKR